LFNFGTPVNGNITLTAQWIPEGFVKVNGGTVSGQIADSYIFINGRTVSIRDMYVCDHEVTQKEFSRYMISYLAAHDLGYFEKPANTGDNYPVFWSSWYCAVIYCNLLSKAEGLTPAYYITINGKNETDIDKWVELAPDLLIKEGGKYYWKAAQYGNGKAYSKFDYTGAGDSDGGIRFDTSANGYRLPTEVEWEYIARGGNNGIPNVQYTYSGSNTASEVAVCGPDENNGADSGAEVKSKKPNTLGIYDMSGNAYEWVWDWYELENNISASLPDIGPDRPYSTQDTVTGRVQRGGSYNNSTVRNTVKWRIYYSPGFANNGAGIRLVRNAD